MGGGPVRSRVGASENAESASPQRRQKRAASGSEAVQVGHSILELVRCGALRDLVPGYEAGRLPHPVGRLDLVRTCLLGWLDHDAIRRVAGWHLCPPAGSGRTCGVKEPDAQIAEALEGLRSGPHLRQACLVAGRNSRAGREPDRVKIFPPHYGSGRLPSRPPGAHAGAPTHSPGPPDDQLASGQSGRTTQ